MVAFSSVELRLNCSSGNNYIAESAYLGDTSFDSLYLEDCFEVIGQSSFESTVITSVRLPNTLKELRGYAFRKTKLKSVVIPEGTEIIETCCFAYCPELAFIKIPASVTTIATLIATYGNASLEIEIDPKNPYYSVRDGMIIYTKGTTKTLNFVLDRFVSITLPSDISKIGHSGCSNLNEVLCIDARHIVEMDAYALRSNICMRNITFGSVMTSWAASAFEWSNSIMDVIIIIGNNNYACVDGVMYKKVNGDLQVAYLPPGKNMKKFVIPKDMKYIEASPFKGTSVEEYSRRRELQHFDLRRRGIRFPVHYFDSVPSESEQNEIQVAPECHKNRTQSVLWTEQSRKCYYSRWSYAIGVSGICNCPRSNCHTFS